MSLSEAMLEIAAQIEEDMKDTISNGDMFEISEVRAYARQIRSAVKAAEGVPAQNFRIDGISAEVFNRQQIETAKAEFRSKDKLLKEDEREVRMAPCVMGGSNGVMVSIDPGMPVGSRTQVSGEVYELFGDGKLHWIGPMVVPDPK